MSICICPYLITLYQCDARQQSRWISINLRCYCQGCRRGSQKMVRFLFVSKWRLRVGGLGTEAAVYREPDRQTRGWWSSRLTLFDVRVIRLVAGWKHVTCSRCTAVVGAVLCSEYTNTALVFTHMIPLFTQLSLNEPFFYIVVFIMLFIFPPLMSPSIPQVLRGNPRHCCFRQHKRVRSLPSIVTHSLCDQQQPL